MAKCSGPPNPGSFRGAPTGALPVPDKLFFRIGEVAALCRVPAYVLRFWQGEFSQLRPNKSGTGQRLYRKRDVEMALRIKRLLYEDGYTIAGAKSVLEAEALPPSLRLPAPAVEDARWELVRGELQSLLRLLDRPSSHGVPAKSPKPE